jgi:hypothetical protein
MRMGTFSQDSLLGLVHWTNLCTCGKRYVVHMDTYIHCYKNQCARILYKDIVGANERVLHGLPMQMANIGYPTTRAGLEHMLYELSRSKVELQT